MKHLILIFISAFALGCASQFNEEKTLLCLDNYTIPPSEQKEPFAKLLNANRCEIILSPEASEILRVNGRGEIYLKPGGSFTGDNFSLEIEARCGGFKKSFSLVRDNFIKNKVVAHRGAWKNSRLSQNSLGSLKAGIKLGCEAVEFDVWYSADNQIVLSHDPIIGGKTVENTAAAQLTQIKLEKGENLPTLKEYLNAAKTQNKTRLMLEVKPSEKGKQRTLELAEAAVRMVHEEKAQAWVEYISFSYDALLKIRELDKSAKISYLEPKKSLKEIKADGLTGIDFHYKAFFTEPSLVKQAHDAGLTANVWTVNKKEDMTALLDMGIDYITTDEPEALLKLTAKK